MAIRKIGIVSRTYQHVNRYRQILTVLIKYGFGDLVDRLHINQYLEIGLQMIARQQREHVARMTRAERVRHILEELGPTFVKIGQVAASRPDLILPEFITELEKLCDNVPPFPFERVREIVESELGKPLEELFDSFDEKSLAAASIGQVHRARLKDGQEVVVKVQRPDIRDTIDVDLEIMLHLATLLERNVEGIRLHRPTRVVDEFAHVLERELDYEIEAAHLERFAQNFIDDQTVYVPKVYRDFSTKRVLTMEYIDGVGIDRLDELDRRGLDRKRIARRGASLILRQIFEHGFFHADPHAGNVRILADNVICYLDYGMMGRLDRGTRENFANLIFGAVARDPARAMSALLRLAEHADDLDIDERALERDVAHMIDLYVVTELGQVDIRRLLYHLLDLLVQHQLRIPPDLITMIKAMVTVEGLGVRLDPEIDLIGAAKPYLTKLKMDRFHPRRLLSEFWESGTDVLNLVREAPAAVREIIRLARRGELRVGLEHRNFEKLLDVYEHVGSRVSFAVVVGSLIIGSSLIVHSKLPPLWGDIPIIGLVGFLAAGVMGLVLLISILRHGRL